MIVLAAQRKKKKIENNIGIALDDCGGSDGDGPQTDDGSFHKRTIFHWLLQFEDVFQCSPADVSDDTGFLK